MRINYNKTAITLIITGISLFIINAADVYLGYYLTHGKGFQIIGIGLMVVGMVIWIKSR
jgi:hypothetical protein